MEGFVIGQRVMLAAHATVSATVKTLHANDPATVLRRVEREGQTNYLVQFDRADAVFGLYWLSPDQLTEAAQQHRSGRATPA